MAILEVWRASACYETIPNNKVLEYAQIYIESYEHLIVDLDKIPCVINGKPH